MSRTTFPGFFQLSEEKFIERFTHDFGGKIVLSHKSKESGVGVCVCEGTGGEFHPDPGQSSAEPAKNAKHLLEWRMAANAQAAKAARFSLSLVFVEWIAHEFSRF